MSKFRSKKKYKKSNIIILLVILIIIGILFLFNYFNKKLGPIVLGYAEVQAKRVATLVINQAISKEVENGLDDDIFIEKKDSNGNIKSVDFNPLTINKMLSIVTNNVQEYLVNLESGNVSELGLYNSLDNYDINKLKRGIIYEVPTGAVLNNALLYNIGPKIPVRLDFVGDIESNIETSVTDYGINNSLVQIYINVNVSEMIMIPFSSKKIQVSTRVMVAMKIIEGSVPNYYNGDSSSKILTVPVQ